LPVTVRIDRQFIENDTMRVAITDRLMGDFDWLIGTFGAVDRVFVKIVKGGDRDLRLEYALITLRFESGVIGHISALDGVPTCSRVRIEVAADDGLLEFDSSQMSSFSISTFKPDSILLDLASNPDYLSASSFPEAVQLRDAVILSSQTGRVVGLHES